MKIHELFEAEGYDIDEVVALIKHDCQPYLNARPGSLVYRGMQNKPDRAFKQSVRADRKPKDTDKDVHDAIDAWFLKEFGFKARSETVFVTGHSVVAEGYGKVYAVFPIGDFKFVWSPEVDDLNLMVDGDGAEDIPDILDELKFQDSDLMIAVDSQHEIMIKCKEYYAVPVKGRDEAHALTNKVFKFRDEE